MNSSSASEKSVVMLGWVKAEPRPTGCGVCASLPLASTRRLSFSSPRRIPVRVACSSVVNQAGSGLLDALKGNPQAGSSPQQNQVPVRDARADGNAQVYAVTCGED
jgi:hypothetical protein